MSVSITGQQIIDGDRRASGDDTFTGINPRTKEPTSPSFHNATTDDINRAVDAAQVAYDTTRHYSAARLAAFLDRVADEIETLGDQLLETADKETGLGLPRLLGERDRTTGQIRKFGALLREGSYVEAIIDTAQPDRQPNPRPAIRRMLVPIGPVAVFSASNFPFAFSVAGGDTASAFAAGCPVVVKGHPGHPATSELFAIAINRAIEAEGFPTGFFSLLQGNQIAVGQELVKHPAIAAVGFTGSLRAGRAIFDTAAARPVPIPVYAEMGSFNPVVLLPDAISARADTIADGLVNSVTLGSGQFCTNPGLIFVIDNEDTSRFIEDFTAKMQAKQPGVLLNEHILSGLKQAVRSTTEKASIEVLAGGDVIEANSFCYAHTVLQTTSSAIRGDSDIQVEHFGPVTLFVRCSSVDDLLATLHHIKGNLTATIHAQDTEIDTARRIFAILQEKAGRLIWNGYPTGVEVVHAMQHGGPYPATTAPWTTSVGMTAIKRFMRPLAYQNIPASLLPDALKDDNPLGIWRIIDDVMTKEAVTT